MRIRQLKDNNPVARALAWLARSVFRHREWYIYSQIVLCAFCVFYTWKCLQFDTSRDNLVGAEKPYHRKFLQFKKEFPTQDDLVVMAESEDSDKNRQFVERLGARLQAETNIFRDVFFKGDLKTMGRKGLLFASESDLDGLKQTLGDFRPFIEKFTHTTNLVSLFTMVNSQFRTATHETNAQNDALIKALPALDNIISEASASLRRPGTSPSPGVAALFNASDSDIYITFTNGRIFLITSQAATEDLNGDAVTRLRKLVEETKLEVPGVNVGLTGEPVLEEDEMAQSQKDTIVASISSLLICALIFIYGYQETGRPMKATFCLIIGLGYTLAFATLSVGHLNILTITFVPILIGLAIDYGVHLISRYEEELRRGLSEEAALTKAMVFTGQGIFTGAFTTAGAFLAMGFTDFKGIQEMGIICGGGLVICLIPMITMLPALLLRGTQNQLDHIPAPKATLSVAASRRARIESLWLRHPAMVISLTVSISLLAATQISKVYFDYNLINMQSQGLPAVETERKLIESTPKSVLFGAVIATNLEQATWMRSQLTNLSSVSSIDSMAERMTEDQSRKLVTLGEIKQALVPITFDPADRGPVNVDNLSATLYSLNGYLGLALEEVGQSDTNLSSQLSDLRQSIADFRKEMLRGDDDQRREHSAKLAAFQQSLFDDVSDTFTALKHQDNRSPLGPDDLPEALHHRFIGVTGKHLLMVYPKKDIWNRDNQKEFIDQVGAIYPDVTGTPVQLYYYTELLRTSYEQAAKYSLMAIVLLILFHFRSPIPVILSLLPVGVGFLWLNGLMGYFNIPYNPANIMTLPLVIGIGVTNGIHILNRFAEEQDPSILTRSTGKAVLISGLTTIAGFGSLMLAKHRGIYSLGLVMSIGLATCMLAALMFLPSLLNFFTQKGLDKKQPSGDNAITTRSGGTEAKQASCIETT